MSNPGRDYNDIPQVKKLDYDTDRSANKGSGLSRAVSEITTGISKDIIKPTLRNLSFQFIDFMGSTIKTAVSRKFTGDNPSSYGTGYVPYNGYSGNATYNPNDFRTNRFNQADGYVHSNPVGVVGASAPMTAPWKNIGFRTAVDAEAKKLEIKKELQAQGYISIHRFGLICGQNWDFALDNYGWTNLDAMRVRYNIIGGELPFDFADIPEPVYLNRGMK